MAEQTASPSSRADRSRLALELVHRLAGSAPADQPGLSGVLEQLARTFEATSAGLAALPGGALVARFPTATAPAAGLPFQLTPEQLTWLRQAAALGIPRAEGGSFLLTLLCGSEGRTWVLWLEAPQCSEWTEAESAALFLAGQTLLRGLSQPTARPRWALQLERLQRQQRLDHAALILRRLAHDFGNVLTGILGFAELALAQPVQAGGPLHGYLTEVHRSAQAGAQLTQQLRLLGRRAANGSGSCGLPAVMAEESKRLRANPETHVRLDVSLPRDLPPVGISAEPLRQVLAVLLDNAREAIPPAPSLLVRSASMPIVPSRALHHEIKVSASPIEVNDDLAADFYGDVRPGPHVEITITDSGCGLSEEGWQRLFHEPFYSTKPRRRGLGLAIAYGILSSNRGGLLLTPALPTGTTARLLVPALPPAPAAATVGGTATGGRILVVDDDQMILQFVSTTLKRAGFQVQGVASAEEALQAYANPPGGQAFQLVLADVLMPNIGGIDLARRLLAQDPAVRVLLMSGQATQDIAQGEIGQRFHVLSKPFRPEGLLRAVRSALDAAPSPA